MSDWIEWNGGGCPVPPDMLIEVRYRYGDTAWGLAGEWDDCWRNDGDFDDIVAYRVIREAPKPDAVNSPSHYTDGGIEAIDYIRAKLGPDGFRFYCLGNVLKYVSRAGKKGDAGEDLRKAKVYLEWAIND